MGLFLGLATCSFNLGMRKQKPQINHTSKFMNLWLLISQLVRLDQQTFKSVLTSTRKLVTHITIPQCTQDYLINVSRVGW